MTTEMFLSLQTEQQRSADKYPPQPWAKLGRVAMLRALLGEVWELALAMWRNDIQGPHGCLKESIQCANVAIRIHEELRRRYGA